MEPQPHVLLAHDPSAYRGLLAELLPGLRPALRVETAAPEDLDAAVAGLRPLLVVCSRLSAAVQAHARAWVVLYPGGADRAEVGSGGEPGRTVAGPTLADLLAAIDAATG